MGGSGTPGDPYLISGWEIDAGAGTAIAIRGVDAHVVIENCTLRGSPRGTGVSIATSPHVVVRNCLVVGLGTGIFLYDSPGVVLEGNRFDDTWTGIEASQSPGIAVRENFVRGARKRGIFLWRTRGCLVEGNELRDCGTGMYLDSVNRFALRGNLVVGGEWGLYLWDSHEGKVTLNVLVGCQWDLGLYHTSAYNLLYHNAFIDCGIPAFDDASGENRWYAPYPRGGNFWGGVELEDLRSGPDQSEPRPDGIGDRPVEIPEAGVDRYPLLAPPPRLPDYEEEK